MEVALMEQFHWTEKQLEDEVTYNMIAKIGEFNSANEKARKIKEANERATRH